jgi:hypothetical protein
MMNSKERRINEKMYWSIGVCSPFKKTKSLYLYCLEGGVLHTVARFRSPLEAERFAQTWGYPLSEGCKELIEAYKTKGGKDE